MKKMNHLQEILGKSFQIIKNLDEKVNKLLQAQCWRISVNKSL
jgi:hypothetical protein